MVTKLAAAGLVLLGYLHPGPCLGLRGSAYLAWEKLDAIDNRKVEELDHGTVVMALRTIFDAAARVAAETMKVPSVGGAVRYVLIGDAARPRRIDPR